MAEHCKRYDCLYHPDYKECHNYVQATPQEQSEIRRRKPVLMTDEDVWSNDYESKFF